MIMLDTHIWVWWVNGSTSLSKSHQERIEQSEADGLGVSAISCWEVAKLCEKGRLRLTVDIDRWIAAALAYPGVELLPLSPQIAIESTRLPGSIHSDPADQIIIATARVYDAPLLTADDRILQYAHVRHPQ